MQLLNNTFLLFSKSSKSILGLFILFYGSSLKEGTHIQSHYWANSPFAKICPSFAIFPSLTNYKSAYWATDKWNRYDWFICISIIAVSV